MELKLPNYPPEHGLRVPAEAMSELVSRLFTQVGMPHPDAAFTASLLVECDLRCVFSHGTRHAPNYLHHILEGEVNPTPKIRILDETPTTAVVDGDGGLGFLPASRAARLAIAKAGEAGIGAASTRNHFHFGAAGLYLRFCKRSSRPRKTGRHLCRRPRRRKMRRSGDHGRPVDPPRFSTAWWTINSSSIFFREYRLKVFSCSYSRWWGYPGSRLTAWGCSSRRNVN